MMLNSPKLKFVAWSVSVGTVIAAAASPLATKIGAQDHRKTTDAPIGSKGKMANELFMAVGMRNTDRLNSLLKDGADPNSRNGLEFTPLYLAAASFQPAAVDALLGAGADINADSPYGTALTFAAMMGNAPAAGTLLAKGADINANRADGKTVLSMAANAGSPELVADLIKKGAKVNETDTSLSSPLTYAARGGFVAVGQILIDNKADIESADEEGITPLMMAAKTGHPEFVKLLLQHGAKVNAKDKKGRTALLLAANYGDFPEVIKALKEGGANLKATSKSGKGVAALAAMHGYSKSLAALGKSAATAAPTRTTQQAVQASVKVLDISMGKFTADTACLSCHHEGLGRIASATARERGFAPSASVAKGQAARVNGMQNGTKPLHQGALQNPAMMMQIPLIEINEVTPAYVWLLAGSAATGEPRDDGKGAMAGVLARLQSPDGSWTFGLPRVPMQSSVFTFTALAVRSINAYGMDKAEVAKRTADARQWLASSKVANSEDRAFKLLGLKWSAAPASDLAKAASAIRADQHNDGGWAQVPGLPSDAYATGQALYALRVGSGLSTSDPAFQKGVKFLLRTQDEDGSWFVSKRAIPANNYLNTGFPHGESQYSSFNATCWATMALAQASPTKNVKIGR